MTNILNIHSLSKFYGKRQVLKDLSIQVSKGAVFGLLGPNGSGKTTTLSILLDIVPATSGTFDWFGAPGSNKARRKIGSLLESPNFYSYLSAEKNLRIAADIKGVPYSDIPRVLEFVNLLDRKKDKFQIFSLGMKQRLAIASALLGTPEVLILDEPTNGLDPQGIYEIRELIQTISRQGITIIIASHLLDEVEKICSDVAIIKNGVMLFQGKVAEILGDENLVEVRAQNMDGLEQGLNALPLAEKVTKEGDLFVVRLTAGVSAATLNKDLFGKGVVATHLVSRKKNLEFEFLEITKEL